MPSLKSQLALFDAVEVAPDRYAYEGEGWRVATAEAFIRCGSDDEYGLDDHSVAMPAWWSPHQQYAWRIEGHTLAGIVRTDQVFVDVDRANYVADGYESATLVRITADLETGAEVVV